MPRQRKGRRSRKLERRNAKRELRLSIIIEELDGRNNAKKKLHLRVPIRKSTGTVAIRADRFRRSSEILSATAHPVRLAILHLLLSGPATYSSLQRRTQCKAGPLYHHIGQLRLAGLILPKQRDVYELSATGRNVLLCVLAMRQLANRGRNA
ncbi:MAG: helix-turn-helix transcriptional regulator [Planctomycetes bacterium]|nr:helix-turn-helix transcriptional regulator [Planctomycetota bacterium]MBI3833339.1 helix-turn-helix transcriptional regulator [Planctomycetota bacterium]